MPREDAAMPEMTAHPMLVELLELASGRDHENGARAHVEAGCVSCARKMKDLATVAVGVLEDSEIERELDAGFATPWPAANGAYRLVAEARGRAEEVLDALRADLPQALALLARDRRAPWYGYLLLATAQGAARNVPSSPARFLQLARALESEAARVGDAMPAPSRVAAEALLLGCQALHCLG